MGEKITTIRVHEETRDLVNKLKKDIPSTIYVKAMANYFRTTNINPIDFVDNPFINQTNALKIHFERIIKILKAQEKRYITYFEKLVPIITKAGGNVEDLDNIPIGENLSNNTTYIQTLKTNLGDITADDFVNVYNRMKVLENENKIFKNELILKRNEIDKLKVELKRQNYTGLPANYVLSILEEFKRYAKEDRIDRKNMYMHKADFNKIVLKIHEEAKKIKELNEETNG